jgi:DNA-binding response OmpR family regulator
MTTPAAPQRHKVLIVDDDPGMVHLLARTLLDFAQLHFAVRGDDALAKLAQHKPDLLVVDAELPDLDGYAVIERMRENRELDHTAVVMVTSHNDTSHRQRAFAAGVLDFFTKPIDRDLIRMRVQQILSGEGMELIELDDRPLPERRAAAPAVAPRPAPPQARGDQPDFEPTMINWPTESPTARAHAAAEAAETAEARAQAQPVAPAAPVAAAAAGADNVPPIDVHAVTSELFERMSAILSQAEVLRERLPANAGADEVYPIQRIQEECAEVIQLLVTISGEG